MKNNIIGLILLLLMTQNFGFAQTRADVNDLKSSSFSVISSKKTSDLSLQHLTMPGSGTITISSGATFTIDVPFIAEENRVFYGDGNVVFSPASVATVKAAWFGNTSTAITKALLAAGDIPVTVSINITDTGSILVDTDQTLIFTPGVVITGVAHSVSPDPLITNTDHTSGNSNITISGGKFNGAGSTQDGSKNIIHFVKVDRGNIERVKTINTGYSGVTASGAIFIDDCSNITLSDCECRDTYSDHGIYVYDSSDVKITGFLGANTAGITGDSLITVDASVRCQVLNSNIYNSAGSAISFSSQLGVIANNICTAGPQTVGYGITVGHAGNPLWDSTGTTVSGNIVTGMKIHGIRTQGTGTGISILGNTIIGTSPTSHTERYAGIGLDASDVTVSNNVVTNCDVGIYAYLSSANSVALISNNIVKNNYADGIKLGSPNCIVFGNSVSNNGLGGIDTNGIYITPTSSKNTLSGNMCFDSQAIKTQTVGILASQSDNLIFNNRVAGNASYGVDVLPGNLNANNIVAIGETNNNTPAVLIPSSGADVYLNSVFITGGTGTISRLLYGQAGQIITIVAAHLVKIKSSTGAGENIYLAGGADFDMADGDTITLLCNTSYGVSGGVGSWYEISRSNN